MKLNILFSALFIFLFACNDKSDEKAILTKESLVETSLMPPVYIENDPTWTIQERMDHYGVPGLSISVIKDSEILWSRSYGVMDKESKEPVSQSTLFQAGSISKPVAAYGALSLVGEGKIDLSNDINDYLTSWKLQENEFTKKRKVGLKHILSHTGGITVHGFLGYSPDLEVPSLIQVLNGQTPANSSAIFVDKLPEESFRYSGGGYTVMQQMMIDVMHKPYPELMNELVLSPLAMVHSTYEQPLKDDKLNRAATGYLPDGTMTKGKRHTYPEMAAAGLWTTSADLALFAIDVQKTYAGESEKVLSKKGVGQMLSPFIEDFIGLGLFLRNKGGSLYFGHGGWDEGFSSELIAHKEDGYGVVILTNSNHPDFISELVRSVAFTYDWENYVPEYKRVELGEKDFDVLPGRYKVGKDDLIRIYAEDSKLYYERMSENSIEMVKITDTTYIHRERNIPIQFSTKEDGKYSLSRLDPFDGVVTASFERLDSTELLPFEYLVLGEFERSLKAYKDIVNSYPEDSEVNEYQINRRGYNLIEDKKLTLARDLFKINTILYPESANVYDSYAESCMLLEEFDVSIENYKKSIELNPDNSYAKEMIEKMKNLK